MQRRSSLEEKNPPVTIRGTLVSVFSNMGERIATFREQVHYKQAHDHAQGVPRLKQNVRYSINNINQYDYFSKVPHSIMPLSCAGHRGLNRSASIESVDGSPQGCYVNWQQNNQPVKGNDQIMALSGKQLLAVLAQQLNLE